ncbi:MAG: undecaprenyldiphospho-muramoylpentapeptide beta-N-acetylglucosaminyltransferase [Bacteroidetes bacterium]|nr:undecaprenyldiphospho-muramoylpentapeptide beta-N-acetylglucosaminyltransferase [Bacteroidota bacterium]
MPKRFVISGGGTGGHIFPAISIAQALQAQLADAEFHFVGAMGKMEMNKVPEAGFPILGLPIRGLNRTQPLKNVTLPWALLKSVWKAHVFLRDWKPDAAIGVGGFASAALGLAALQRRIPLFIQEQNAFAGKTNSMLGKYATKIFVAHPGMERFFPAPKIEQSGNPVRAEFETPPPLASTARLSFGLLPDKPTILITGGSLGAGAINTAVDAALEGWLNQGCQLIWQTGERQFQHHQHHHRPGSVWVSAFIPDMRMAYAAADLAISRAGAMAIAELMAMKVPSILVPLPTAAEDHQTFNALSLSNQNAAVHLPENQLRENLESATLNLLKDEGGRAHMRKALQDSFQSGAANKIASSIIQSLNA